MQFLGNSIRRRLLLVIAATVLASVVVHDVVAVREVRHMAITVAATRLQAVSNELADMIQTQTTQMRRQLVASVRRPAIIDFLREPTVSAKRDSAAALLQRGLGAQAVGVTVWDPAGNVLLRVGSVPDADPGLVRELLAASRGGDSTAISRLLRVRDSLVYGMVLSVSDASRPLGAVVEWRRFARTRDGRRQLLELIGSDAGIYVGNAQGDGWTDFAELVPRPDLPAGSEAGPTPVVVSYERPGAGRQLGAIKAIAGTPWMIVVEFRHENVVAPVRSAVQRLVLTTIPLLLTAIAIAWWFGARLTNPLRDLAGAATGISAGDYDRRVRADGPAEVQTLARAFNQMADSIGAAHDSLEERADELARRAAELDACLGSAPVGFALYDAEGRYRRVNASLASLHGVEMHAHTGRTPSDVNPALGTQLERHVRAALDGGTQAHVELSADPPRRGEPAPHWLASVFPIRTSRGESLGVGSVVTDLTAYKELERQLLQAQKMEAVGRLAGGVAHDFNNILTAISGFSQFVLHDLDERRPPAREDVEQVLAAAERGGALTKQLLAFSRQQVLQPRVLDLNAVVTSLGSMLARLIGTDIELSTRSAPRLSAVKADPSQMEQVIANLVVNARDAMPNGGTIMIETADVELDESYAAQHDGVAPGHYVMLAVTDSGTGMDAATRARLFDPFFTTKELGKGTGLGLSIVYGIVKQSGGNIEVYSEPGRGTSLKVYLPRCAEPAERPATPAPSPAPNGRAIVLLVDDDAQVSAAARRALERAGYVVLTASDGAEGLRVATEQDGRVDLLITDIVMPGMGGRELARQVSSVVPGIRVLYTSGYTAEAMNQQAILEAGDAFLGKPFTPDALLRRVSDVLRRDGASSR
jgi:PAS domain S-box-containing protein